MTAERITVFGGTGFLGRRIVDAALALGWSVRAAVRRPERARPPHNAEGRFAAVPADIREPDSLAAAMDGVQAAVNAVALYHQHGGRTFQAWHVDGARAMAEAASRLGLERLVLLSGIGADPAHADAYVNARGRGEQAVRQAFPAATILRPSTVFAEEAGFLVILDRLVRFSPVIPLFGRGDTRLQPVYAGDVADAAVAALVAADAPGRIYELGGPEIVGYRDALARVMRATGRRRPMVPLPFAVWEALARAGTPLPRPPVSRGAVALMRRDNIAAAGLPGLAELGVTPTGMDGVRASQL